jgi:prevent-host-death family protein
VIGSNPFRNHFGYWLERAAAGEDVVVTYRGKPRVRLSAALDSVPSAGGDAERGAHAGDDRDGDE